MGGLLNEDVEHETTATAAPQGHKGPREPRDHGTTTTMGTTAPQKDHGIHGTTGPQQPRHHKETTGTEQSQKLIKRSKYANALG